MIDRPVQRVAAGFRWSGVLGPCLVGVGGCWSAGVPASQCHRDQFGPRPLRGESEPGPAGVTGQPRGS